MSVSSRLYESLVHFSVVIHSSLHSHLLEWQTMQSRVEQWGGPQRALSPQHRCILAQGSPVVRGVGGGWEWRQGEGGLKWFVTWFCSLLGVFYEPLPFLGVRCSLRSVRIEVILVFHPFFGFKGVCLCVFSQRENHGGLTDDWLIQFTLHPV